MSITVAIEGWLPFRPDTLNEAAADVVALLGRQHPTLVRAVAQTHGPNPDIEAILDTVFSDSDVTMSNDGSATVHYGLADYSLATVEEVLRSISHHVLRGGEVVLSDTTDGWRQTWHYNGAGVTILTGTGTVQERVEQDLEQPDTEMVAVTTDVRVPARLAHDPAAVVRYLRDVMHYPGADTARVAA